MVDEADAIILGFDDGVIPDGYTSNEAVEDDAYYGFEEDVDDELTGYRHRLQRHPVVQDGAAPHCFGLQSRSRNRHLFA